MNVENEVHDEEEHLQKERLQLMLNTCRATDYKAQLRGRNSRYLKSIIVDDLHKVLYCVVPKTGSTNWIRTLMALSSDPVGNPLNVSPYNTHNIHHFKHLYSYKPSQREVRLKSYLKFMFVRNPYERLLSAFKCIFQKPLDNLGPRHKVMYTKYRRYLAVYYRKNVIPEEIMQMAGDALNTTFEEFIQYITDKRTQYSDPFTLSYTGMMNPHWAPMLELCNPCRVKYDVIGHHETMTQDVDYVLKKMNVRHLVKFPSYGHKENNTRHELSSYYKLVSTKQFDSILSLFRLDFVMFNYSDTTLPE